MIQKLTIANSALWLIVSRIGSVGAARSCFSENDFHPGDFFVLHLYYLYNLRYLLFARAPIRLLTNAYLPQWTAESENLRNQCTYLVRCGFYVLTFFVNWFDPSNNCSFCVYWMFTKLIKSALSHYNTCHDIVYWNCKRNFSRLLRKLRIFNEEKIDCISNISRFTKTNTDRIVIWLVFNI